MNDLISREASIDAIYKNHMNGEEGVKQDLENLHGSAACFSETLQDAVESIEELPTVPAIPIPDNATNGDVIKALFPRIKTKKFTTFLRVIEGEEYIPMTYDWWNSPYKRGETE